MRKALVTTLIFGMILSAHALLPQAVSTSTRFGKLEVNRGGILVFKDIPVEPKIQVNTRIDLGTPFQIGDSDIVLVIDEGGTACPFQYHFVTLNRSGAHATKAFGTCNEATSIKRDGDSIIVRMRGYRGPFEPQAERQRATEERHTFAFHDGTVKEIGH